MIGYIMRYKDHRLTMPEVLEMLESCKRTGPARTSESRSLGLSPPGKTHAYTGNPRKSSYDRDLYVYKLAWQHLMSIDIGHFGFARTNIHKAEGARSLHKLTLPKK